MVINKKLLNKNIIMCWENLVKNVKRLKKWFKNVDLTK